MYKVYNQDATFKMTKSLSELRLFGLTSEEVKKVFYSKVTKTINGLTVINCN